MVTHLSRSVLVNPVDLPKVSHGDSFVWKLLSQSRRLTKSRSWWLACLKKWVTVTHSAVFIWLVTLKSGSTWLSKVHFGTEISPKKISTHKDKSVRPDHFSQCTLTQKNRPNFYRSLHFLCKRWYRVFQIQKSKLFYFLFVINSKHAQIQNNKPKFIVWAFE